MSTDCETVPSQSHTTKPMVSDPPINNSPMPAEHHSTSGISYEGRVSLIPPLAGYEATMRAAMELDRNHSQNQQMAMDTTRVHNEQQYNSLQMQEFRRMYEHRMRMHEASQVFAHREDFRQPYAQPHEPYTSQEVPKKTSPVLENMPTSQAENRNSPENNEKVISKDQETIFSEPSSNVPIKEEPMQLEERQPMSPGNSECGPENHPQYDTESVLRFAHSENPGEPTRSPIDKAGESPDLPTDSARIQPNSTTEQHDSFHKYDSSKHNDNVEQMSPYEGSYHGSDDHMPSSVEPDICDPTDSSSVPPDSQMDPLSQLQHALELSNVMSGKDDDGNDKPQVFQCHVCSYSGTSRFHFNAHLNTHYDHKCAKCEFVAHTEPKLREHMQDEHGLSPDSTEDLEAIRVPRVNAQGKVKTFKCKQCDYVAITKGDFWEHARSHIKSEKLLTCPKCPFVTEYKHHLEYHLRNHFGSKPFKCNKCNYSCVNKSMLNSHMKSHSNIYQYRCSDCNYATKYCHSLKLHLRKYGHNPAMVLNPDGSPNPIPIIDVYGTRRGPKLKKDDRGMPILPPHYQIQAELLKAQMQMAGSIPVASTSPQDVPKSLSQQNIQAVSNTPTTPNGTPHSPFHYPYTSMVGNLQSSSPILSRALEKSPEETRNFEGREQLRELLIERERLARSKLPFPTNGMLKCSFCEFSTDHREIFSQHMMLHASSESRDGGENEDIHSQSPQNIKRSTSPEGHPLPPSQPPVFPQQLPHNVSGDVPYSPLAAAHNLKEYLARAMNPFLSYQQMMGNTMHPAFGLQQLNNLTQSAFHPPFPKGDGEPSQISPQPSIHQTRSPENEGVLDLSKEQTPPQQIAETSKEPPPPRTKAEARASFSPHHSSPQSLSPTRSETSTPPSKSRRKGRAFKLERIAMRLSESAEGESSGHDDDGRRDDEDNKRQRTPENRMPPLMPLDQFESQEEGSEEWQSAYNCNFCDMAFKDVVMYTMHMGYHGYHNPFTCNMCGHQAADKVAFFLHIARSSHS
ncbi:protein hunchback [Palaemon carinicauda]|uniref:protein hunchback n=1 Tax=Palaemon carinicauda TaxID=392227 RepID=UPI0035B5A8BC